MIFITFDRGTQELSNNTKMTCIDSYCMKLRSKICKNLQKSNNFFAKKFSTFKMPQLLVCQFAECNCVHNGWPIPNDIINVVHSAHINPFPDFQGNHFPNL